MNWLIAAALGYLLGSFPTGMVVARIRGVDLTAYGSGRTGSTNVLRTLGKRAAAIVFAGDFLKGVLAYYVANVVAGPDAWAHLLAAVAAVAGHSYSPFIGFKGGRGVVTAFGVTTPVAPLAILAAAAAGFLTIYLSKYVSLGSIVGTSVGGLLMVLIGLQQGQPAWIAWGILVAGFVIVLHRDNIQRLRTGTERRVGQKVEVAKI